MAKSVFISSTSQDLQDYREAVNRAIRRLRMLPIDMVEEAERPGLEGAARGARAAGTPWISFFAPDEIVALAVDAGFTEVEQISTRDLADRQMVGRADGLRASSGEGLLLART